MNAFGIVPGTASAGTANGSVSGASNGLPLGAGSASGFAGMLVQVIGGAQNGTSGAAPQGLPVGLLGMLGLVGQAANEADTTDLLVLLNGLTEQLNKLDEGAELPVELQDQLAALLLMLQNLLQTPETIKQQSGGSVENGGNAGMAGDGAVGAETLVERQPIPNSLQTMLQALRKSVQQVADRLSQGGALPVQVSALTEPLRQTLEALQQATAKQHTDANPLQSSGREGAQAASVGEGDLPANKAPSSQGQPSAGVKAQSVVRQTALPLRNPIWSFHGAAASDVGQTPGTQTAIASPEAAESGSPSQATPVWTMLKADATGLPTGAQAGAPASAQIPVQQFAEQMGKFLVKQFVLTQGNGTSEAKISLHPEHLGQVDIKIMIQNGLLTAKFVTEHGGARDLLEAQLAQLRTTLQSQGLQVEKMEVVQQSAASAASFFHQQHRQQSSGNQENRTGKRRSGDLFDGAAAFELELERTAYLREIGFGSSLNVTA